MRAEAFSYFCANFQLQFFSLQTAVLFFTYVGDASFAIRSLVLKRLVLFEERQVVESFLSTLEVASELSEVRVEGFAYSTGIHEASKCEEFEKRLRKLEERNVVVQVDWKIPK